MSKLRSHRREPPGPVLTDENATGFAACVVDLASEVLAAERRIWAELELLAERCDVEGIRRLLARRRTLAPVELAAELDGRGPNRAA